MLINGIQLSSLGATLHNRVLSSNKVKTTEMWNEGAIEPTFVRQQDTFKQIELQFLIAEKDEEDAFTVMSNLTMLLKRATIIFDDMPNLQFDVSMVGEGKQNRLTNGNFIYTIKLKSDYAKSQSEIHTTNSAATDAFNLSVVYYKDKTQLVQVDTVRIKAADFEGKETVTFSDLGIDVNKYRESYYNEGSITNFVGEFLTYDTLRQLGTLIINYSPIIFYKDVAYYLGTDHDYELIEAGSIAFTYQSISQMTNIGQLIDLNKNRPEHYRARTDFHAEFSFENIMAFASAISVYYDRVEDEQVKNVTLTFTKEENGEIIPITEVLVPIAETSVVEGSTLAKVLNVNRNKPNDFYQDGVVQGVDDSAIITFEDLADNYTINYSLIENKVYVEFYKGEYPGWVRVHTDEIITKYSPSADVDPIAALNLNLNQYKNDYYNNGVVLNRDLYVDYNALITMGVIQIYYVPIEYTLTVQYKKDLDGDVTDINTKDYTLTDLMFLTEKQKLSEIIDINLYRPEGYKFSEEDSYSGELTLGALIQASPISIVYKASTSTRTKSVVIKYKKQLQNTFSTINTAVVTIAEDATAGGIRMRDLFEINKFKPEYYDDGIVDGYSYDSILTFDEIDGTYDVYYFASTYSAQLRYYTDEVDSGNWVGTDRISFTVLSFDESTTLVTLGADINKFQPPYCDDGVVQPFGTCTFATLVNIEAINIVYPTKAEPIDPDGINYPHRILFLQHNDMGSYDNQFPSWTLNHAYINTGVIADDIAKTTISMSTIRVFKDQPLYEVNVGNAYLFGAVSPMGSMYLRYENNTKYTQNPTGKNYFRAMAGYATPSVAIEEDSSNGFSRNTGIYSSERDGYSYFTLTYSNLIQSNEGNTAVPLYLFACDYNGNYSGGIAGVGISGCKIYKDGVLVRDFIPVAYYDLIGTQVAPSNCLYDKVTQTFFEDATGLNSFNIIDDDEYEDTDPLHKIGKCFVNYYKDGAFFQTRTIYFRGNEFISPNVWDPEEKLEIDRYQPDFHGAGEIVNLNELGGITFENVNNFVFEVNYPATGYYLTVNYYKDSVAQGNLIQTEQVPVTESMFYSVPTFGQIVPLLKYKPEGYELKQADIPYKNRVTFKRLLAAQPFNIVYTEAEDPEASTTIRVKYYKHKNVIDIRNPLNEYQYLGEQVIDINNTDIIDGVYPETFMNFNLMKPANEDDYWYDGVPYEWYLEDENLITPDVLSDEYIIVYEPVYQNVTIKYYTDEIDPDDFNLIATDTWRIKINDWAFDEEFQIVDELPNNYINKYKPNNCGSGLLQNPERWYTFISLMEQGHLDILYETLVEPHDPDDDSFPAKILWYRNDKRYTLGGMVSDELITGNSILARSVTENAKDWQSHDGCGYPRLPYGATIPYINLGYTPKELQRLAIETKAYSVADSAISSTLGRTPAIEDYCYFLGYVGAVNHETYTKHMRDKSSDVYAEGVGMYKQMYSSHSPNGSGFFGFRGHIPMINGFSKQLRNFPTGVDGNIAMRWVNGTQDFVIDDVHYRENHRKLIGGFRLGNYAAYDENYNLFRENDDHIYERHVYTSNRVKNYSTQSSFAREKGWSNALNYIWNSRIEEVIASDGACWCHPLAGANIEDQAVPLEQWSEFWPSVAWHPTTMLLDAYHNYVEIYDKQDEFHPEFHNIDTSGDLNLWNDRCRPKGPITLFTTTNPDTGEVNICSDVIPVYPWVKNYRTTITSTTENHSQEEGEEDPNAGGTNVPGTEYESHGGLLEMEYNPYTIGGNAVINCPWIDYKWNAFPVPLRTLIWGVKIWDRGRLVRDLIPVAKGDQVYDYVMPENGLFDKVTEIFFGNSNEGGTYTRNSVYGGSVPYTITADQVQDLRVNDDPTIYGKIIVNYYDYDNTFLGNKWVRVPTDYNPQDITMKDLLAFNEMKPSEYYHDGMLDADTAFDVDTPNRMTFKRIWDAQAINVYYKQKQYTKTVVYYNENTRIASKDFFFSQHEIEMAHSLEDLGIEPDLYHTDEFKPGVVMSDESIIESDDVAAFINAPSPIVVYKKYTKEERPDLLYVEYYRGGAYEEEGQETIVVNSDNHNYLDCDLSAVVLNPSGSIKYLDHYHSALYEDEEMPYFIAYQVDVIANYVPVHKGPARAYSLLATITDRGRYTIIEERNGWGRLKEYPKGWILLEYTQPITGPGQNPDYDPAGDPRIRIAFGTRISITKMTIDRLWGYCPEHGSWIKTEEISFDQSGRLYNALALKVIKLNEVDWSNVSSLSSLGIDVQKYKLRFHENSSYTYDGEYTQAAFSDLHSIDIVYPETIYPYVVKYYQNQITEDNVIGRGGFTCSLSDWNPDWDTFISTSYLTGYDAKIASDGGKLHRVIGKTEDVNVTVDEIVYILDRNQKSYNGQSGYYYVLYHGYIGYLAASQIKDADWTTQHSLNPVLYRAENSPLMLDWTFFGLDPNLYKPDDTYFDGILTWNPHTYDNQILNFSFEELITTNVQNVLYVKQVDLNYHMQTNQGWIKLNTGINNFVLFPTDEEPGIWDLELRYRINVPDKPVCSDPTSTNAVNQFNNDEKAYNASISVATGNINPTSFLNNNVNKINHEDGLWQMGPNKIISIMDEVTQSYSGSGIMTTYSYLYDKYYEADYYEGSTRNVLLNTVNFSNKRKYTNAIVTTPEQINRQKQIVPILGARTIKSRALVPTKYTDSSSGDRYTRYSGQNSVLDLTDLYLGSGYYNDAYYNYHWSRPGNTSEFYHIKVWKNYVLQKYLIFLPKGYWLPNGIQAQEDVVYDLISGTYREIEFFQRSGNEDDPKYQSCSIVGITGAYNPFVDWQFEQTDINALVRVNTGGVNVYRYPDVLSDLITTIEEYTDIPVYKKTEDAANHVQGTWYHTGTGWIQGSKVKLMEDTYNITKRTQTIITKGENDTPTAYKAMRKPVDVVDTREHQVEAPYLELLSNKDYFGARANMLDGADNPCTKIQFKVSGTFKPLTTTTTTNHYAGYLVAGGGLLISADYFNNTDLSNPDDYYTVTVTKKDSDTATMKIERGNTVQNIDIDLIKYDMGSIGAKSGSIRFNGNGTYRVGSKNYVYEGQSGIRWHGVSIYNTVSGVEYTNHEFYPRFIYQDNEWKLTLQHKYSNNPQQVYTESIATIRNNVSPYIKCNGDYSIVEALDALECVNTVFYTQKQYTAYAETEDFVWIGNCWIPKSYTHLFVVSDEPTTYIVQVSRLYDHTYPVEWPGYRQHDYPYGDRITVVGHYGKNSNWMLLSDDHWILNNDNLLPLITE